MALDRLASGGIDYPIVHFTPTPARPVIPTAAIAAHLAQQISEIIRNASPEERKRRQLELNSLESRAAILAAQVRQHGAEAEIAQMTAGRMREHYNTVGNVNEDIKGVFGSTPQINKGEEHVPHDPEPQDFGDTSPNDYYGNEVGLEGML